eukprot:TRINITY_DN4500_c0_g1_i2.p1 TRINITY_DN4500_c0_g1~~TRINITY_DN4500_c0_g1_i2.p1  ORF type:complete len:980 (+),score=214.26 TRINITY_DN4500_c0_g1_i2:150-3089(+)
MPRGKKRKAEKQPEEEKPAKKIKLDIFSSLSNEENILPDEIVLKIFNHQLDREDLLRAASVCRQWFRIGQEDIFAWTEFNSFYLTENPIAYRDIRENTDTRYRHFYVQEDRLDEYKEEVAKWHEDPVHLGEAVKMKRITKSNEVELFDKDGDLVAIVIPSHQGKLPSLAFGIDTVLWKTELIEIPFEKIPRKQDESPWIDRGLKFDYGQRIWKLAVFLNVKVFDDLVMEAKKTIVNLTMIIDRVGAEWRTDMVGYKSQNLDYVSRPMKSVTAQKQPDGFKTDINLFKYQLDAVTWMKSIENNADQDVSFCTALRWRGSKVYFDFANKQLVAPDYLKNFIFTENIRGGILGDEVGLGKTFEILGLVLASPPKEQLDPHPTLIESRATLVMCPNHLSKQWQDEIERATDLKVFVINTITQLRALTYEKVRSEYDIIICVYQLFETPNYCCLPNAKVEKGFDPMNIDWSKRNKDVEKALKPIKKSNSYGTSCPILDHIYWHRVVLDEGHDVIHTTPHGDFIAQIKGRFKWYVTATPFANFRCLESIKEFIGCKLAEDKGQETFQTELVLKDYFWRNTKESVKEELTIPDTVDEVKLVEFSNIERAIYMSRHAQDEYYQLEGCSFGRLGRDLHDQMLYHISHLKDFIPKAEHSVNNFTYEVTRLRNEYENNRHLGEEDKRRLKRDIKWQETMLQNAQKALNVARNVLKILELERDTYDGRMNDKSLSEAKKEYLKLQEKHGTKLAEMILYLKNLLREKPESRVIMFSQFDATLTETASILKEHGIKSTFVTGNVYMKTKAIESFKNAEEDVKVIMLSLDKTAAGTNLIAATHIILLDPVRGTKKEAQAVELQAIGRAHRQGQTKQIYIVRFVVKNSIDHKVYLRNNNLPTDSCIEYDPETYQPSVALHQSRPAMLSKSGSFSALTVGELNRSFEIPKNNTNEKKETKKEPKKKAPPKKKPEKKKNNNNVEEDDVLTVSDEDDD